MTAVVEHEIDKKLTNSVTHAGPATKDAALVAAAKKGDSRAFEVLVGRYQSRIRAIASRFTRVREDAEDIAQQSFQKAFIHLKGFEGNAAFSTWLTRITINEALMWLRRKRASPEVPIEESGVADEAALRPEFPDSDPSPEDRCLQGERKRILTAAINKLTPGMRTAIELRELGELSTEETAQVMELSVGAVKARVFHGRRKLRAMLRRYVEPARSAGIQAAPRGGKLKGIPGHQLVCSACD